MKEFTTLWQDQLKAGLFFTKKAKQLEDEGGDADQHRAFVIGTILSSVAFLEARFNEFYRNIFVRGSGFPPRSAAQLEKLLDQGKMDRLPILEKYQLAIFLARKAPLPEGDDPYQPAAILVDLRNAIAHFRPVWASLEDRRKSEVELSKLESRLRGRFALNSLMSRSNPFFPDLCLGSGCAAWSVTSAFRFTKAALTRVGLRRTGLEPFEGELPKVRLRST